MLVPVVADRVHIFASRGFPTSARRMNLAQPAAARIRSARLGAPGAGSGAVCLRSLEPGIRRGSSGVVMHVFLSGGAAAPIRGMPQRVPLCSAM
ncbi:hypothetical protein SGA01_33030 [Streptomyces gardneri]|uniref:Uncharacterized protein n=1 Tax=Streptomyces gardneri TaxID=66892 RepID=A0A4Y3RL90_9ACTN|nr:hypothetical protein SGA01_33030 [Streptomyces gardneri]